MSVEVKYSLSFAISGAMLAAQKRMEFPVLVMFALLMLEFKLRDLFFSLMMQLIRVLLQLSNMMTVKESLVLSMDPLELKHLHTHKA